MTDVKKIAVLTSGGDAPGMNACVRGVVRAGLNKGWEVFGIRDAFRGLVGGGDNIFRLDWVDTSWNFREGGTFLGSVRFVPLMGDAQEARKLKQKAMQNLRRLGITGLVVIGGDGSLTGAYELYAFLKHHGPLIPELSNLELSLVGIPGSIDNDIAFTDMSIGADTTLNTIVDCIDKLRDTATSHKRISIVEVMGRLRGYLAVMSGLATGADRIFIREEKITQHELHAMLQALEESFAHGQKAGVIVRSEGALFSTNFLKETISVLLEPRRDVRETVLGHLQRGGNPTAFERILATRMGVKAIQLLEETFSEPQMVGLSEGRMAAVPLAGCLARIREPEFQGELSPNTKSAFRLNRLLEETPPKTTKDIRVGILTDGNNVSGMNMALRAVARLAINSGLEVVGIKGGFSGLAQGLGNAFHLEWSMLEMKGILRRAGTLLGVSAAGIPTGEQDLSAMQRQVENLALDGLVVIGNGRTYDCAARLSQLIRPPVVGIPADLRCIMPATDWVIGMDSAVNDLIKGIDRAADAAHVLKKIFLIHIRGEYCPCLIESAALAGGAEIVIIDDDQTESEEAIRDRVAIKIKDLQRIITMGKSFATIIFFAARPAKADRTIDLIKQQIAASGLRLETSLMCLETSLGGIVPTAFDRILAQRLGEKAIATLQNNMGKYEHAFHLIGIHGKEITVSPAGETTLKFNGACLDWLTSELDQCTMLMAQPSNCCVGMGGDIEWTDTVDETEWYGTWTCKKCLHTQRVSFNPKIMLCVKCENEACHNYGYIRISRRL